MGSLFIQFLQSLVVLAAAPLYAGDPGVLHSRRGVRVRQPLPDEPRHRVFPVCAVVRRHTVAQLIGWLIVENGAPSVQARDAGDVLARFQVMLDEAAESVRLIGDLLDDGTGTGSAALPATGGSGLGWAESPRGEALAWVELDSGGRITRARLRPASVRNWRSFDDACRSQNVFTDIPIVEASFWLTVAGTAR